MAEMHGRDLTRRHVSLFLLVLLPLCFYLASMSAHGAGPLIAGGIGMAFSVSGATLFSVLSSEEVDQRLVLGGYRPPELLLGRVMFLAPLGLLIGAGFSVLMAFVSDPHRPWVMAAGVSAVALQSIPFGLAVGAAVNRELEGTLLLIGVVGMQLATSPTSLVAKFLPFYGPAQLLETSVRANGPILVPALQTLVYGVALLIAARVFITRRVQVSRHARFSETPADRTRSDHTPV
ncbi:MAG: hypothetical protein WBF71_05930 [Microthrixaceae bacterium]